MEQPVKQLPAAEFLAVAERGLAVAASSLDILVSGRLSMEVLWAGSVRTSRLGEISGSPEDLVVGAYVCIRGDAPGHALLAFPRESAFVLVDMLLGLPSGTTADLGDMEQSAIEEVANILIASYLNAIADHYGITLMPDPPLLAMDMTAAIIENVLANSGRFEPETLSIVTRFRGKEETLDGFFLYIPDVLTEFEREVA